jgi:hypothetical protein
MANSLHDENDDLNVRKVNAVPENVFAPEADEIPQAPDGEYRRERHPDGEPFSYATAGIKSFVPQAEDPQAEIARLRKKVADLRKARGQERAAYRKHAMLDAAAAGFNTTHPAREDDSPHIIALRNLLGTIVQVLHEQIEEANDDGDTGDFSEMIASAFR